MRASNEINEIKILFIVELRAIYLTLSCSSDHACYQSAFPDVHPKVLPLSSTSRNRSRNRSPQWQGWRCAPSPPELGYSSTSTTDYSEALLRRTPAFENRILHINSSHQYWIQMM